ncbi:nickel transporter [Candidatus Acidianus copahuensis]|uniref:Nickel/cobalt efflux system n=2 Tax=Candidatus Acidianus copahuensis TaxID=1160895 RepID=A0A031LT09_9CREN|nr:HoxN/HupN/NixA family nickel/cobalt transporter [Candidatus Acidianus copahuensis]EZQ10589.1 nickel transporter [Candidatus Acidianus copahuensis]
MDRLSRYMLSKLNFRTKMVIVLFYFINILIIVFLFLSLIQVNSDTISSKASFFSLGSLAFMFGLRHAVDADHIAAIDNATRKLTQEKRPSLLTGTFFSLGHSTVVLLLSIAIIITGAAIKSNMPTLENIGSILGTLISGGVLYILGSLNFFVGLEIYRLYKQSVKGNINEQRIEETLNRKGLMNRYFRRFFSIIKNQYYMYPIGFLFGLGFDTASETALLALTATSEGIFINISPSYILVFPLLFTAGMVLVDSTDGFFMNTAYRWAFLGDPIKKIWYNLTMTVSSILVAFLIGSLELLGLLQSEIDLYGGFWNLIAWINSNTSWSYIGLVIVGTFASVWTISIVVYKYKVLPSYQKPDLRKK